MPRVSVCVCVQYIKDFVALQSIVTAMQVVSALEKLSTRERFLNSQCQNLTAEYREAKEVLSRLQMLFSQKQDAAAELENELAGVAQVGQ